MSCAQIKVTSGGTFTPTETVSFPGAYSASDPYEPLIVTHSHMLTTNRGILVNIYDNTGNPNGAGRDYKIPGPAVIKC